MLQCVYLVVYITVVYVAMCLFGCLYHISVCCNVFIWLFISHYCMLQCVYLVVYITVVYVAMCLFGCLYHSSVCCNVFIWLFISQ